jgi:hypothetical protein
VVPVISFLLAACTVQDTENSGPTVQITSPSEGSREAEGVPFTVAAAISDDATTSALELTWTIDPEPDVERNPLRQETEATLYLPDGLLEGTYDIGLAAVDDLGAAASDSVQMNISSNAAPKVSIDEPADGARFDAGDSVGVEVTVRPGNDSMADIWLTWGGVAADLDDVPTEPNPDGRVIYLLPALSKGRYKLSVTAHDQGSESSEDEVVFNMD